MLGPTYRLPWTTEVTIYELDLPEVLGYKATCLKDVGLVCNHHLLGTDLTQPWEESLLEAGYCPEAPSIWLIEGLLMYLSSAQVHTLLASVSRLANHGSHLGIDLINIASLEYEAYRGYFRFGCDTPEDLLSLYGWQSEVIQPGDEGANFGRYPWMLPAREVPNVIRAFLVTATKSTVP
jgi:methyltransferase (TIGR00027 family)